MKNIFILTVVFLIFNESVCIASGDWPDIKPYLHAIYDCRQDNINIRMEGYSEVYNKEINMEQIQISGLSDVIKYKTNSDIYPYQDYLDDEVGSRTYVANSKFSYKELGVSGYGYYRSTKYQINLYSNKLGDRSNTLDMFVYDFINSKFNKLLKIQCEIHVNTVER